MTQAPTGYVPTPGLFGPEEEEENLLLPELKTNEEILYEIPGSDPGAGMERVRQAQSDKRGEELVGKQDKPLLPEGPLGYLEEAAIIAGNAGGSIITDYLDLGHGLVDIARQGSAAANGGKFEWDQVKVL